MTRRRTGAGLHASGPRPKRLLPHVLPFAGVPPFRACAARDDTPPAWPRRGQCRSTPIDAGPAGWSIGTVSGPQTRVTKTGVWRRRRRPTRLISAVSSVRGLAPCARCGAEARAGVSDRGPAWRSSRNPRRTVATRRSFCSRTFPSDRRGTSDGRVPAACRTADQIQRGNREYCPAGAPRVGSEAPDLKRRVSPPSAKARRATGGGAPLVGAGASIRTARA
jgi:hypothetical protein